MFSWEDAERAQQNLVSMSKWLDRSNAHHHPDAVTWGRISKITEEAGEAIGAYIGYTGQNPRKGKTHMRHQVIDELLDVAVTALGAVEHLSGHQGLAFAALADRINAVARRAGVEALAEPGVDEEG